ncbi:DUF58 domain-containing protein [Natrarchaeobius oligotrophus]|nr:DUF58 domain-containing protein [Natrarchaeobius chitinivorans]
MVAAVLVVLAVVFDDPLLLAGSTAVCAWIVARQFAFTSALGRTIDSLSIDRKLERRQVRSGDSVTVTLAATLEGPSPLRLSFDGGVPTAAVASGEASTASLSLSLEPGTRRATISRPLTWPVSGDHRFDAVTMTATDGFLRETLRIDDSSTITVTPPDADLIDAEYVGARYGTVYGDHEHGRLGSDELPSEPREYIPGETADKIDWKATARLGTTFVREYETGTDRQTTLVVDHRESVVRGSSDVTTFDVFRELALSIAERAFRRGDSVGLVCVDDDGISTHLERTTSGSGYRTVRRRLLDLEPTVGDRSGATNRFDVDSDHDVVTGTGRSLTGDEARRRLAELTDASSSTTDDPFTATLVPIYEERARGTDRIPAGSLVDAVTVIVGSRRPRRVTIFTDGSRSGELREAVSLARTRGNEVVVFLPPGDDSTLRRDLTRLDRVSVLYAEPPNQFSRRRRPPVEGGRT